MWRPHVCYVCKRSVCGGDEPQPVAHLSHKLQCARQSSKIMVSYGNKYPRHNARPLVVEQSGQCARALTVPYVFFFFFLTRPVRPLKYRKRKKKENNKPATSTVMQIKSFIFTNNIYINKYISIVHIHTLII